jgi:hypothetical protein
MGERVLATKPGRGHLCPAWHWFARATCRSAAARNAVLRAVKSAPGSSIAATKRTASGVTTRIASVRPCRYPWVATDS